MEPTGDTTRLFLEEGQPVQSLVQASAEPEANGLVYRRVFPFGEYHIPATGKRVKITMADALQAAENFRKKLPGPEGIPIDQRADHSTNPEGAYGWLRDVQARADGCYAGIAYTPQGRAKVESKEFTYLSPEFYLGDLGGYPYQDRMPVQGTVITRVAMCSSPLFKGQDPLALQASELVQWGGSDTSHPNQHTEEDLHKAQEARQSRWHIQILEGDATNLTPPKAYRAAAPSQEDYADPVNYKYPMEPEARLRAAAAYFSKDKDAYDEASQRIIWVRIVRAEKHAGIEHAPNPLDKLLPAGLKPAAAGGAK